MSNIVKIDLLEIDGFKNHPFSVKNDSSLNELLESIKTNGVLNPIIVRKKNDKFGNWFRFAKQLLPDKCIYELDGTFRTNDDTLLALCEKVRNNDSDIVEYLSNHNMSTSDYTSMFEKEDDEILLCLNYDCPYGINSINKYLQSDNPNIAYEWGYKYI